MSLKIGFLQPNFQTGPKHLNSFYLPYALGCLWSYARQHPEVTDNYEVAGWMFQREDLEQAVEKYKHCDIVLASMYVWNARYCFKLLSMLKQANPDMIVVVGGPEVPWRRKSFFLEHPYIDTVVINEGEQAILQILRSVAQGEKPPQTLQFDRMIELHDLPSPYLTGLFDQLIADNPDIEWVPTLETDRGCPFKCTFCDWGSATGSKMYKFNQQRIQDEITWFVDCGMPFITMTTSNFGAFKVRDMEVAKMFVAANKRTGRPTAISTSYGKNNAETIFEISRLLLDAGIQTGAAVSFQTTTAEVLTNIKRDNMKINRVGDVADKARAYGMPVLTELIMGLPGETFDSWVANLNEVFVHKIINLDVFFLQLIENAPMNVNDTERFELTSFAAYDYFYETTGSVKQELEQGTAEVVNVIKSTSTLSEEELFRVNEFSWFAVGTHCYGLSTHIADYLYKHKGVRYSDFYLGLMDYLKQDSKIASWFDDYRKVNNFWKQNGYSHGDIGGFVMDGGWKAMNSFMPVIHHNQYLPQMIEHVIAYCARYDLDPAVVDDVRTIVPLYIKHHGSYIREPLQITLKSDLLGYSKLSVQDRYNHFPETLKDHVDYMFFARRRNWYLNLLEEVVDSQ